MSTPDSSSKDVKNEVPNDLLNPIPKDHVNEASLKLFPDRRPGSSSVIKNSYLYRLFARDSYARLKCEKSVKEIVESSPMVKLMMAALNSSGCPVDISRHIACEPCNRGVTGGYDPTLNQIVICYNQCSSKSMMDGVLGHELLHAWDYCRANLDFDNVRHVACTEIRAANLFHCSIMSGFIAGSVSLTNLSKAHSRCVKQKAVASILAVRPQMDPREAWKVVDSVFDKCYNDLEPIGRRVRRNSRDRERAYRERYFYGYDD